MEIVVSRPGDSLGSLARRFGLSAAELAHINQLSDPRRLTTGLALAVPAEKERPRRGGEIFASPGAGTPREVLDELLPAAAFISAEVRYIEPGGGLSRAPGESAAPAAEQAGVLPLMTVANTDGEGNYSAAIAHPILAEEEGRQRLLDSILRALEEGGYGGVHLCLCSLHPFDRESYNSFLALASPALHRKGYYLFTSVAPKEKDGEESLLGAAYDYAAHGRYADRVNILAFDWGYAASAPQAVSPVDRIRPVLDYAAGKLAPGRTLLAFSGQGYSWPLPWRLGQRARPIAHTAAVNLAVSLGAEVKHDRLSRGSYFTYTDAVGQRRVAWFEDARSVLSRLRLVEEYGLAGVSLMGGSRVDRPALQIIQSVFEPEKTV